jgi:hypothetical protein
VDNLNKTAESLEMAMKIAGISHTLRNSAVKSLREWEHVIAILQNIIDNPSEYAKIYPESMHDGYRAGISDALIVVDGAIRRIQEENA